MVTVKIKGKVRRIYLRDRLSLHEMRFLRVSVFQEVGFMLPATLSIEQ